MDGGGEVYGEFVHPVYRNDICNNVLVFQVLQGLQSNGQGKRCVRT